MALTPDESAFKRRQVASLREAHPNPAPHVAEAIARLEAELADAGPTLADQLAAAHRALAALQASNDAFAAAVQERDATIADLRTQLAAKPAAKPAAKRKA